MKDLAALGQECIAELNAIGIYPKDVTAWTVNCRAKSIWGRCNIYPNGNISIEVISDLVQDDIPNVIPKNIIMHELLHTLVPNHSKAWKELAGKVSAAYPQYDIQTTVTIEEQETLELIKSQ